MVLLPRMYYGTYLSLKKKMPTSYYKVLSSKYPVEIVIIYL